MNPKIILTFFIYWGIIIAQVDINYSYQMQYGKGNQITGTASNDPDTSNYRYFENMLDVNAYFGENIYLYTQLEYSNDPIYGKKRSRLDSLINTFYLEYSNDRINIKFTYLHFLCIDSQIPI